ncbi:MAG: cytochrome c [Bacteroidota bacterium]
MKKIIPLIIFLSLIITACQHADKKVNGLLNKNNLPTQVFTINTNKDTMLHTANGAIITIPQGALSASNVTVELEIKEAYSMQQILLGGLTTQSNGQPLSSGGMIYMNAVAGQSIKITKTISIKIPATSIDKNMQLFKGEADENASINWVDPEVLPVNPQLNAFDNGRVIFMNNCASCHNIGKDATGPDLAYILTRTPDKKLLYEYTRNSQKVMAGSDDSTDNIYYRCLYQKRNKTPMNSFPGLSDEELDKVYGYIENESGTRNLPMVKDEIRPCIDSCRTYWEMKNKLQNQIGKPVATERATISKIDTDPVLSETDTTFLPEKIAPPDKKSLYYQFEIKTFGWYNVDVLLTEPHATNSALLVRITGEYKKDIKVFLVVPSAKVCQQLEPLSIKENTYGNFEGGRDIWLPQHVRGYIIAMGEAEGKIIFSKTSFSTAPAQTFGMQMSVVTKAFFKASVRNIKPETDNFSATEKTGTLSTIARMPKELKDVEKMKPACDCDCGYWNEGGIKHVMDKSGAMK